MIAETSTAHRHGRHGRKNARNMANAVTITAVSIKSSTRTLTYPVAAPSSTART
jgi:hypothetical protein